MSNHDRDILRSLAGEVAALSQEPVQAERIAGWTQVNDLKPNRPMVYLTEIPWGEFSDGIDELRVRCVDPELQRVERDLRQRLFVARHLETDEVVPDTYYVWKKITGMGFGLEVQESTIASAGGSSIVAHEYEPVIKDVEDIQKLRMPAVQYDEQATMAEVERLSALFGDLLPVKAQGLRSFYYVSWDMIVRWTGVTQGLMDLVMRPEYVHALMRRLTDVVMEQCTQVEALGLLDASNPSARVGSGGAGYTDALPQPDCDGKHFRLCDQWGMAASQIFAEVSPEMHEEFALQYEREVLARAGLSYYGCCEALHNKMHLMATIPNLRKISISPWCDTAKAYENATTRYVFSHKPSPAVFASARFDPAAAETEIRERIEQSRDMPCEIVMKDISTVRGDAQRLIDWCRVAMRVAREFEAA